MKECPEANPSANVRWVTTAEGVTNVRIFGYFKFIFVLESAMFTIQVSLVY